LSSEVVLAKFRLDSGGFPPEEMARMQAAFQQYLMPNSQEIHKDDLEEALRHLGYMCVEAEDVARLAEEVTKFSTLDLGDFANFTRKYSQREQEKFREMFDQIDTDRSGELNGSEIRRFMASLGFTPLRSMVREALDTVDEDGTGSLNCEELVHLLAVYRASEGFTRGEVAEFRSIFNEMVESVGPEGGSDPSGGQDSSSRRPSMQRTESKPQPELPPSHLTELLLRFFGPLVADAARSLGKELNAGSGKAKETKERSAHSGREGLQALTFPQVLVWARRLREMEFSGYREKFKKYDTSSSGILQVEDLRGLFHELGYWMPQSTIDEFVMEALEEQREDGCKKTVDAKAGLDYDAFVSLMMLLRRREGFSKREYAEMKAAFDRFDDASDNRIEAVELGDILRYLGHHPKLEEVQCLVIQVDFDQSGDLNFREFLRLMRLHREVELELIRKEFEHYKSEDSGTMPRASLPKVLAHFQCGPLSKHVENVPEADDTADLGLEDLVAIVEGSRTAKVAAQRRCAGFSDEELERFREIFAVYDRNKDGGVQAAEINAMITDLGFPMQTVEDREKVLAEIERAREAAKQVGVEDAGEAGAGVSYWVWVQLLRVLYRRDDRLVLDREARAIEQSKFSHGEVDQFRGIFLNWFENDRLFEAAAMTGSRPTAPQGLLSGEAPKVLSKDCVRRLLRSLGVTLSHGQRILLDQRIDGLEASGSVDFADFLRLMRWMLDIDFAGIQELSSKAASTT